MIPSEIKFVIAGPNEGKTIVMNSRSFVDGVHAYQVVSAQTYAREHALISRSMSHYSAFPEGSAALEQAQAVWAAHVAGLPEPAPLDTSSDAPLVTLDLGQEPTERDFENQKLIEAIKAVDPEVDALWNASSLPLIGAVEKMYGQGGLNRRTITDALPGWDRSAARAAKAQSETPKE